MFWTGEEAQALKHGDSLCGEAYFSMWEDSIVSEQSRQDSYRRNVSV